MSALPPIPAHPVTPAQPGLALPAALTGRRLPSWAPPAVTAGAVAVAGLLFAATPLQGRAGFVVVTALLSVGSQTALSFAVEGRRRAVDRMFSAFVYASFAVAAVPLVLILWYTVLRGIGAINLRFLTVSMFRVNPDNPGGGIYHAIVGTLEQAALATLMAAPIGVLAAVYLVEYGRRQPFARAVSFFVDVMTGVPSIVAGLFIYALWILTLGFQKSGFAGSLALFILMLPVVIRATEEMLKLVPAELREAAYALGVPKWRTILRVVLPTALAGIVTGITLGVARIMGETAPLLLLVGTNSRIETNPFASTDAQRLQEALPTFIYEQFRDAVGNPDTPAAQRAWGAALTLIALIMLLTGLARLIARLARVRG
ncbi:MAG: phosphate ABC transporter permease PstA [Actinobacteria bacterium]|nr:phosphate ABC transporter permease PstA [Actinomycetota bacterium]MBI3688854.1 phosphate ABC transporter permease PstA [Actinomycetota bacterium]